MPEEGTRGAPASGFEDTEGEPISPFRTPNRNSPGGHRSGPAATARPLPRAPGQALKSAFYELFHFPNGGVFVLLSHLAFFFFFFFMSFRADLHVLPSV